MEWKQNGEALIVFGTIFLLMVCVVLVIFIINHKRRLYGKQMLIDLYENDIKSRVGKLEKDNLQIKKKLGITNEDDPE